MKNDKTKFYNLNECKTEFLFESDAEKAILNEAAKPKRKKGYKIIICNTFFITIFFICIAYISNYYQNIELQKINATINNIKNNKELNEKLNEASKKLENPELNKAQEIQLAKTFFNII